VGSPNVRLLYDIYHQKVTEGNLIATITANIDKIAHFHAADVPGRHEPGTGEINWPTFWRPLIRRAMRATWVWNIGRLHLPPRAWNMSWQW